jgi:VanZ family protein
MTEYQSMCVAFLVASGYGTLTELNQVWIPGRFPSTFDVMFNGAGGLIFIWLYWFVSGESSVESRVSKVESKEGALTSKLSTSS